MTPVQFLSRLASLIPPPRFPLQRLSGVFGPRSPLRASVFPRGLARRADSGIGALISASGMGRTRPDVRLRMVANVDFECRAVGGLKITCNPKEGITMRLQIAVKRSSVRRILRGRQVEREHSRYAGIEADVCRGLGHVGGGPSSVVSRRPPLP